MASTLLVLMGLLAASPAQAAVPDADTAKRNRTSHNVVHDYYPRGSLMAGEEGVVGFKIALDKTGKLDTCFVTESSGYPRLDAATCEMIVATARFQAVREESGRKTTSAHEGAVEWRLPPGYVKGPPPREVTLAVVEKAMAGTKLVCRRTLKTGSLNVRRKVCLSPDDWSRTLDNARRETDRFQNPPGRNRF